MTQGTEAPEPAPPVDPGAAVPARPARPKWWVVLLAIAGVLVVAAIGLSAKGRELRHQREFEAARDATTFTFPATLHGLPRQDTETTRALATGMTDALNKDPALKFTVTVAGYGAGEANLQVMVARPSAALTQDWRDGYLGGQRKALRDAGGDAADVPAGPLGGSVLCGSAGGASTCIVADDAGLILFAAPGSKGLAADVEDLRAQIEHRSGS